MEEDKIIESNQDAIVQEKPKKNSNAALILGIIGTSTGIVALMLLVGGFFFQGAGEHMIDNVSNDRASGIEVRMGNGSSETGMRR
ncbi:MAG: hypothetical protein PHQ32_05650 [Firmicutes bacterium]|nr:hypothetical protein [Bacillota bacterium]